MYLPTSSMANTYTQIHIQAVFAVKYRDALIHPCFKERLHQYMTGIIQNRDHKLLAINSMPDHIHLVIGYRPHESLASLIGKVKGESSEWINHEHLSRTQFRWQEGYGAFSYSISDVPKVIRYIENQEQHHQKKTFSEEYKALLKEFGIESDPGYHFRPPE